jgi:quinol monooxygenase YgiN
MIHVIAIVTAKPGTRDGMLEAFRSIIPVVHAEAGCIEYGAATDADGVGGFQARLGPDTFLVIEKWESLAHLRAHSDSRHMATFHAKVNDLIASRVVHVLSPAT